MTADMTRVQVKVSVATMKRAAQECRDTFEAYDIIDRAANRVRWEYGTEREDREVALAKLRNARRMLEVKVRGFVGWLDMLADIEARIAEREAARCSENTMATLDAWAKMEG